MKEHSTLKANDSHPKPGCRHVRLEQVKGKGVQVDCARFCEEVGGEGENGVQMETSEKAVLRVTSV